MNESQILDEKAISRGITRISHEIIERNKGVDELVLIGIRTRGAYIAKRIQNEIFKIEGKLVNVGELDISLYRDDVKRVSDDPVLSSSKVDFDLKNKIVILIDDVLYTGRTSRGALDAIMDIGRPKAIQLAVLIDRGHRELPIRADYIGKNIQTSRNEIVSVKLFEVDSENSVTIIKK